MSFSLPPQEEFRDDYEPEPPKPGDIQRIVAFIMLVVLVMAIGKWIDGDSPPLPKLTAEQQCMYATYPDSCLKQLKSEDRRSGNTQVAASPVGNR